MPVFSLIGVLKSVAALSFFLALLTTYCNYKVEKNRKQKREHQEKVDMANRLGEANTKAFESERDKIKQTSPAELKYDCTLTSEQKKSLTDEERKNFFRKCAGGLR